MKKAKKQMLLIASVLGLFVLSLGAFVFTVMNSDEGQQRDTKVQMVSLLAPPPPPVAPKIQEQPKEQEKVKQETVEQQVSDMRPSSPDHPADDTPPGKDLGVDAEGTAGSDGFGLQGRKGGRGLLAGGGGSGSIFGWYTSLISTDLQKMVNEIIQQQGGLPEGKWKTVVKLEIDVTGKIKKFSIIGSSGNQKMDAAVTKALANAQVTDPPPPGMPRIMKLSFTI